MLRFIVEQHPYNLKSQKVSKCLYASVQDCSYCKYLDSQELSAVLPVNFTINISLHMLCVILYNLHSYVPASTTL